MALNVESDMQEKCPVDYMSISVNLLIYNDNSLIRCNFFRHTIMVSINIL